MLRLTLECYWSRKKIGEFYSTGRKTVFVTNLDYNSQKSEARHAGCLDSHLSVIRLAKNCTSIALVNF